MIDIQALAERADPFGEHGRLYDMALTTPKTLEAFAALILEDAAKLCESHQDKAEEDAANKRFRDADKTGDIDSAVDRGQHWMAVSTMNAAIRNCATAIRALKPKEAL